MMSEKGKQFDPLEPSVLLEPGDSEAVKRANAATLNDLESVMSIQQGRRVVWRLIEQSGVMRNAMTGNSMTYYILGEQALGNELMQILNTDRFLGLYRKMQDEALAAERARLNQNEENKDV